MSNDSNEQGNDTAAFQVGDRVRWEWDGTTRRGTIIHYAPGGYPAVIAEDTDQPVSVEPTALTLISRAPTRALAPAQTADAELERLNTIVAISTDVLRAFNEACRRDNVTPVVALNALVGLAAKRGANAAVDMLAPSEPVAPPPAATPPALDICPGKRSLDSQHTWHLVHRAGSWPAPHGTGMVCENCDACYIETDAKALARYVALWRQQGNLDVTRLAKDHQAHV